MGFSEKIGAHTVCYACMCFSKFAQRSLLNKNSKRKKVAQVGIISLVEFSYSDLTANFGKHRVDHLYYYT